MTTKTDIAITFPNLMGYSWGDASCPMIITNLSGLKAQEFLKKYERLIPRAHFGAGFQQLYLPQRRVEKFIACAFKHGLKAERMTHQEMRERER